MIDFLYRIIIYLHVLSAMSSIGPFFLLLSIVNKLPKASSKKLSAYLTTFKVAVSVVKHSGHVLVLTGSCLVIFGPWTWKTPWILTTLIILLGSSIFLARAFSPTLRKFTKEGSDKNGLTATLKRTLWIYLFLLIAMLWFMVDKPTLWA